MIIAEPALIPDTLPEPSTDAVVLVVLHAPPARKSLIEIVDPVHTDDAPPIGEGPAFTVTTAEAKQPEPAVYFMVAVPADAPVTMPVPTPTVATNVFALLQVPLPPSLRVVVPPLHKLSVPEIADGRALTVTPIVLTHPLGAVYDIVAVPTRLPVTIPLVPTLAVPASLLIHVPPGVASARLVVEARHRLVIPVIGSIGLTVTIAIVLQPAPVM